MLFFCFSLFGTGIAASSSKTKKVKFGEVAGAMRYPSSDLYPSILGERMEIFPPDFISRFCRFQIDGHRITLVDERLTHFNSIAGFFDDSLPLTDESFQNIHLAEYGVHVMTHDPRCRRDDLQKIKKKINKSKFQFLSDCFSRRPRYSELICQYVRPLLSPSNHQVKLPRSLFTDVAKEEDKRLGIYVLARLLDPRLVSDESLSIEDVRDRVLAALRSGRKIDGSEELIVLAVPEYFLPNKKFMPKLNPAPFITFWLPCKKGQDLASINALDKFSMLILYFLRN